MTCILRRILLFSIVVFLAMYPAQLLAATEQTPEIGAASNDENDDSIHLRAMLLDDLGTELDFGTGYIILTGSGAKNTYSGMPQVGVGVSFLVTPHIRTFLRLDYAFASTDPFNDVPGFEAPQETTIKSVPMTFGLRFNMSQNQRLRLNMGIGMQVAWQQEETFDISYDGNVNIRASSGFNFGFVGTFGPELVLGKNKNLLGLEFGMGGTKGDVNDGSYNHNIDLTGFTTRLYYAISL
jgi:hypothetical protein